MGEQLAFVPLVSGLDKTLERIARAGGSDHTLRRYSAPARSWLAYCAERGEIVENASTGAVIAWLDARMRAHCSASQLTVSLAALRFVQRSYCAARMLAGGTEPLPYARDARPALDAWCRSMLGETPRRQKQCAPMLAPQLVQVVTHVREHIRPWQGVTWQRAVWLARRDCALLLLGWWGALRADDLSRLTVGSVTTVAEGLRIELPNSKTGPATIAIARYQSPELCAANALHEYLTGHAGSLHASERLFAISPCQIGRRVALLCERAGVAGYMTGHSMRRGFATEASRQQVPDALVQRHARWKSPATHANYIEEGSLWRETPTTRVSLLEVRS